MIDPAVGPTEGIVEQSFIIMISVMDVLLAAAQLLSLDRSCHLTTIDREAAFL